MLCEVLIYPHSTHICRYIQEEIYEGKEPERFICKNKKPHTGVKVGAQLHFCDTELHFNKTDVKTKNISLC